MLDHNRDDAVHIASILTKNVVLWHQGGADKQRDLKCLCNTFRNPEDEVKKHAVHALWKRDNQYIIAAWT